MVLANLFWRVIGGYGNEINFSKGTWKVVFYPNLYHDKDGGVDHINGAVLNSFAISLDILSLVMDVKDFVGDDTPKTILSMIYDKDVKDAPIWENIADKVSYFI